MTLTQPPPDVRPPQALSSTVARLERASKRYGKVEAVRDVSLEIRAGEVVALLGPNGAGKTTAINLLLGLVRPTSGKVSVVGRSPQHAATRMRTAAMLQISGVPETLRVREHIELFSSYYPSPMPLDRVLEVAGLTGLERRLYGRLSGGQQQRLHLALALSGNPDLIYLDEPTTGLDVASRRSLWEQVRQVIGQGRTVVLTTHYLEEADALADRIVLIDQGSIIADGTPAEIKAKTAGKKVRARTSLDGAELGGWPSVKSVHTDGGITEMLVTDAESVTLELLRRDASVSDLEVVSVGLEDAFLALTTPEGARS
jgi:ABC-2 type transport system ATP-binding protein